MKVLRGHIYSGTVISGKHGDRLVFVAVPWSSGCLHMDLYTSHPPQSSAAPTRSSWDSVVWQRLANREKAVQSDASPLGDDLWRPIPNPPSSWRYVDCVRLPDHTSFSLRKCLCRKNEYQSR